MDITQKIAAAALIALAAGAPLMAEKITHKENNLLAAGFVSRTADTPERSAMLARLPDKKFVRHADSGVTTYVYADAKNCNCLYVGSEQAYGQYRRAEQAQNIADEQRMAAEEYRDSRWNWGAWGPFGGPWGGFGFHRRIGW